MQHFYSFLPCLPCCIWRSISQNSHPENTIKQAQNTCTVTFNLILMQCYSQNRANTWGLQLSEDFFPSIEIFLALPYGSLQWGCNMLINGWHRLTRNNIVQDEKAGTDTGFVMQDSPLEHTVPYPASGSYQCLNRANKIYVISSDTNNWYQWHWQNRPCCSFCNSSGFWLTRHFNKHTATIPTQEGAGAAVMKARACETRAMARAWTAFSGCPAWRRHRGHCWEIPPPAQSP